MRHSSSGFTLMEMMIVVAIIAILGMVTYPSYSEHVAKGYRSEGQAFLNDLVARQERFFAQNNTYVTDAANLADLGVMVTAGVAKSLNGKYQIGVGNVQVLPGDGGYTMTVAPLFNDTKCGNLTLNARGVRSITGTGAVGDCWR